MNKIILHIEDDFDTRELVKTLLEREGHNVLSASEGREGLRKIIEKKTDLVILDIMLPDMSGWDIYQRLKELSYKGKIVFLTIMSASNGDVAKLRDEGVSDYIQKPFENKDFLNRINCLLCEHA